MVRRHLHVQKRNAFATCCKSLMRFSDVADILHSCAVHLQKLPQVSGIPSEGHGRE